MGKCLLWLNLKEYWGFYNYNDKIKKTTRKHIYFFIGQTNNIERVCVVRNNMKYKRGGRTVKFERSVNGKKMQRNCKKRLTDFAHFLRVRKMFCGETRGNCLKESKMSQHYFSISQHLNILQCGLLEYKYIYKIVYNEKEI